MVILLLTVDHWTFDVVAFPLFVVVHGLGARSSCVGFEPGPRLRRARHRRRAAGRAGLAGRAARPR